VLADNPGSDFALQADLAIQGRLVGMQNEYVYRRIHDRVTSGLDKKELANFYRPDRADSFADRGRRIFEDHLTVIRDSGVSNLEKARMSLHLRRRAVRQRQDLFRESVTAVKKALKT